MIATRISAIPSTRAATEARMDVVGDWFDLRPRSDPAAGKEGPMAAAKDRAKAAAVDLHALRARVISVGGPFNARTLIEMPTEVAAEMFPDGALAAAGPSRVLDAVERDLAKLRERDPALADSGLAAGAVAMAIEVEHPFNSATSKSMCQGKLFDALAELRRLAPPEKKEGELHDIKSGRALRLASGGSGT